jgi:hypothetical protein
MSVRDCNYPWTWLMVTSDGAVQPCCFGGVIDRLDGRSAEDVWNGKRFQKLRLAVSRNEIHPVCKGRPCKFVQQSRSCAEFFDEEYYVATYPDVKPAIRRGEFATAREHFERVGAAEGRRPNEGVFEID